MKEGRENDENREVEKKRKKESFDMFIYNNMSTSIRFTYLFNVEYTTNQESRHICVYNRLFFNDQFLECNIISIIDNTRIKV